MKLDLPYLLQDKDRHGKPRLYVRRHGIGQIRLKSTPGTPAFVEEYGAALGQLEARVRKEKGISAGTLGWLVNEYENSYQFQQKSSRDQRTVHLQLRHIVDAETAPGSGVYFRDCPLKSFTEEIVRKLRKRRQTTPGAANKLLINMRVMFDWALEELPSVVKVNPCAGVKPLKYEKQPFHTWTEEEVTLFEQKFPVGTMPRLALDLMLFTGTRRSDAAQLGPKHLAELQDKATGKLETWIVFTPQKTKKKTGKQLSIPLLDVLRQTLAATPHGLETFLVTQSGKPFAVAGFGNWFKDKCRLAGLPHCTAHGLRKVGAVRAAEGGATEKQMMALFGWDSPTLAAFYAKQAEQKKLAKAIVHTLVPKSGG